MAKKNSAPKKTQRSSSTKRTRQGGKAIQKNARTKNPPPPKKD